jgi:hypothetical protein
MKNIAPTTRHQIGIGSIMVELFSTILDKKSFAYVRACASVATVLARS